MSAYDTRKALEQSVLNAWDRRFSKPSQNEVDRAMAETAVADVCEALRYNPAWAKSLGIDTADTVDPITHVPHRGLLR